MKAEELLELIRNPITTLEYPDPAEHPRTISDEHGHDDVFLEDFTWHALCHLALDENRTVPELCSHIDLNIVRGDSFAPGARLYVLRYAAERMALPPGLRPVKDLISDQRRQ